MKAAIIVTTKGTKSETKFFEQASEGKRAFRSLKGNFDTVRYWELSRPTKRIKKKAKPATAKNAKPATAKNAKPVEPVEES